MNPQTTTSNLLLGDCRETLKEIEPESVQTCITSPPYFGLRDYGDDGQMGLEATPEEYVANMVEVFREVRRVLRDDGTLWLNLGDSYVQTELRDRNGSAKSGPVVRPRRATINREGIRLNYGGLKTKNLVGIPWRVAFALQSDGWCLRQDIIWHKPNPMPESVTDRCTKSHEYIFLLSKSSKYYYDHEAIKEPAKYAGDDRGSRTDSRRGTECNSMSGKTGTHRNKRSVWTVTTKPYKEAHFATYPPALITPCVLAGSRPGDIVLDPFTGAGTTGLVAVENGRNFLGCELNPDYRDMAVDRINNAQPYLI